MNRRHGLVAAVLVLLALCAGRTGTVSAHAELTSSSPADGAVVDAVPSEVELVFSENVGNPAALIVLDPEGIELAGGDPAVVGDTMTRTIDSASGASGTYTISYQVTSADGHPISGSLAFSVGAPSAAAPEASSGSSSSDPTDASPAVVAVLAGTLAVALAAAVLATRRMIVGGDDPEPTT